jgi:hypothetical protein
MAFVLLVSTVDFQPLACLAQGTAFTYQGRLTDDGSPANGVYDFRFRLAADPLANSYVGGNVFTNGLAVLGGLFTVTLDFGTGIFNGSSYWLEVDVRTNGSGAYTTLEPLQPLTPTPYAIFAAGASNVLGTVPAGGLAGNYSSAVTFTNGANSFTGTFAGNGAGLTNINAAALGGLTVGPLWTTTGNSNTIPGANFVGTADNQPLDFRVNNGRVLQLAPTTNTANFIGGDSHNFVAPGVYGAVIGGGGTLAYPGGTGLTNKVLGNFGTIGGGAGNTVDGTIFNTAGDSATVAGGYQNSALGNNSVVGGGSGNLNQGDNSTIAGGSYNFIGRSFQGDTIAGGIGNTNYGHYNFIGGGVNNYIANSYYGTINGGFFNNISDTYYATVGGGGSNVISSLGDGYETIGGGANNYISWNARSTTISGGAGNSIGIAAIRATIAGGRDNLISSNAHHSVISGGESNLVQINSDHAVISGGFSNQVSGFFGAIPGGDQNVAGTNGFAAGHRAKANHTGSLVWADSQDADFATTATNQFLIRASGGVGIGTSSPNRPLSINASTNGDWLSLMDNVGVTRWHLNNLSGGLNFAQTGVADDRLFLSTNGYVGIGTAIPGHPLTVQADGTDQVSWRNSSYELGRLGYAGGVNAGWMGLENNSNFNVYICASGSSFFKGGNVGIGTNSPQTALHVLAPSGSQLLLQDTSYNNYWSIYTEALGSSSSSGNLLFVARSGSFVYFDTSGFVHGASDRRLKRDIASLGSVLGRVLQLRPVSYHMRSASEDGPLNLGLIAQEVEPLFPEVVGQCNDMKSLAYTELVPVTIRAIQELNQKLEQENIALKQQALSLEKRLERLEQLYEKNDTSQQTLGERREKSSEL